MADKISVKDASAATRHRSWFPGWRGDHFLSGSPLATFYDNTDHSGTKLEAYISSTHPLVIFFADRFAPRFVTGLYLELAANLTATIWTRQT